MKATAVDLRRNMKRIKRALDRNEPVTLTYHGKEIATIVPKAAAKPGKKTRMEDHPFFGMWKDREDMKDPAAWVRRIRQPRYRVD